MGMAESSTQEGAGQTGIIVLAKFDSSRFPGKALEPIAGRPLLGRVLDRMRKVSNSDLLIVATSDRLVDDPIANFVTNEDVALFRGTAEDVAWRCEACCRAFKLNRFVRICGDSPFVDPVLTQALIELHMEKKVDVATNVFPRTWPAGNSIEVVSADAMSRLVTMTTDADDREHVTRFFHNNSDLFSIENISMPSGPVRDIELTVDYPVDKEKAEWIISRLSAPLESTTFEEIVTLAREWGQIEQ